MTSGVWEGGSLQREPPSAGEPGPRAPLRPEACREPDRGRRAAQQALRRAPMGARGGAEPGPRGGLPSPWRRSRGVCGSEGAGGEEAPPGRPPQRAARPAWAGAVAGGSCAVKRARARGPPAPPPGSPSAALGAALLSRGWS
ncbi:unnamed protein product [Prorocentrum cordatum]|uniref:Uncharacterized protein n=1 Tax=Prorocentrum cordatum TaxID=2364126 RepID=A0ABN9XZJ5_9DINO|nr:unnamed protein product [Polarella glacialis]